MNADTETNVEVARSRAEKLIADGAQVLIGAFDSGQSTAIAQVAEQKGMPFVINIAAAPPITEQGYKFVFRNFPTAGMILATPSPTRRKSSPRPARRRRSVVFLHVNDTFGTAMKSGIGAVMPKFNMPYKIMETISYDPTARDLSVEISKAKATGADALLVVSRLNDAILLTRELVKQRWSPQGDPQHGPGLVRGPIFQDAGQARRRAAELRALVRSEQEAQQAARGGARQELPGHRHEHQSRLYVRGAAGRRRRLQARQVDRSEGAGRRHPHHQHHRQRQPGPGIPFNEKGQNDKLKNSAIQNRGGKLVTVAPKGATNAKAEWPMVAYDKRK